MSRTTLTLCLAGLSAFSLSFAADAALLAKARAIHGRVLKIDTHNDITPANFTADCNYTMRLATQVNLPKMADGGMDAAFLIVYTGQGPLTAEGYGNAYRQAIAKFDAIHRLTEKIAPDQIGLALTPAGVIALHRQGKRAAVIGIENGYAIGTDLGRVREFYERGGRYLSLAHNGNSQLADSNTGERQGYLYNNGLSPLGRQVIAEMNRLGMMVDLSHPSKGANLEALRLSRAPVIASHSGVRSLARSSRNMDDEQLLALKKNGGVIQIVGFGPYLKDETPGRAEALSRLRREMGLTRTPPATGRAGAPRPCPVEDPSAAPAPSAAEMLPPAKREEYRKRLAEIDAKYPPTAPANVADLVNHIDYAVRKIGIEHVGIASDFDGGGGIEGWNSAADAFNVTLELVKRGYTESRIEKLWGGNLLRVWAEVERTAQKIQAGK